MAASAYSTFNVSRGETLTVILHLFNVYHVKPGCGNGVQDRALGNEERLRDGAGAGQNYSWS